jgi:hypothetical protein
MRNTTLLTGLGICAIACSVFAQQGQKPKQQAAPVNTHGVIVLIVNGTSVSAKILDPDSTIIFNGSMMRAADFAALFHANSAPMHLCQKGSTPDKSSKHSCQYLTLFPPHDPLFTDWVYFPGWIERRNSNSATVLNSPVRTWLYWP